MAKSIRSKIKRKNRAEFRATIGTAAYDKQQAKIQQNLQDNLHRQQLHTLDGLAKQLNGGESIETEPKMIVEAAEEKPIAAKGVNKIPTKARTRLTKHKKKRTNKMEVETEKRRPRFFCQF